MNVTREVREAYKRTGKLKFRYKGFEYEYDGDPLDLLPFIQQLQSLGGEPDASQTKLTPETQSTSSKVVSPSEIEFAEQDQIDYPTMPDETVKQYIMSKPAYQHNLFEIQEHFYQRTFKSRGETQRMYHRTAKQLRKIRKEIASEQQGKFIEAFGEGGIKRFMFKKEETE